LIKKVVIKLYSILVILIVRSVGGRRQASEVRGLPTLSAGPVVNQNIITFRSIELRLDKKITKTSRANSDGILLNDPFRVKLKSL